MNRYNIRKAGGRLLAAATGAAVMMSAYAPSLASAAQPDEYISEVFLSYGNTPADAKSWLEKNGYTVLDQDLNEQAESGVSWLGLASTKRSVYLGYKTTTDSKEAITDMRAMNMNGGYSYDEYEKLLENKKSEINSFVSDMKTALAEYRENYNKGLTKAKLTHDKLNKYLDDDSDDAGLGDLLLKPVREEMTEEEYDADPDGHADMTTLIMQGNIEAVKTIMTDLCLAADTAGEGWLTRLNNSDGYDGLYQRYENSYSALSESKLTALMQSDYDEPAKLLAEKLADLKESLKSYTECPVKDGDDTEKIDAYFKEHPEASRDDWIMAGAEYTVLSETKFEDKTLADLVNGDGYELDDPDGRMVLYPMIDAMSEGQRALLSYVDLGEMILTGSLGSEGWDNTAETTKTFLEKAPAGSVYAGVDRTLFQPGGIALTSQARKLQAATGSSYSGQLFGMNKTVLKISGFVTSAILLGAGVCSLIHANALKKSAEKALLDGAAAVSNYQKPARDIAERFGTFLEEKGINMLGEIKLTSDFNSKEKLFNLVYSMVPDTTYENLLNGTTGHLPDNIFMGKVGQRNDEPYELISCKKLFKEFQDADPANRKAVEAYENAYGATETAADAASPDDEFKDLARKFNAKSKTWQIAGAVLCIAGVLIAVGTAAATVYDLYNYYHQDYAPIPRMIVHESTDDKGRFAYTYYSCTLCNRAAQGFGNGKLGDWGDMNGDVGKQWLALYTTKDKAAGDPITADIIAQKGSNKFPADKGTTVRLFGQQDSLNIVSTEYGYNDKLNGLYIFSGTEKTTEAPAEAPAEKPEESSAAETVSEADTSEADTEALSSDSNEDKSTAAGSVVGTGAMVGSCIGSAAIGALICFLITRRRRNNTAV